MSRIGKKQIMIPKGVDVKIKDNLVSVSGPKGELSFDFRPEVGFEIKDGFINVSVKNAEEKKSRELWGTSRALLANMIMGVINGYEKKLEINGVGYRASVSGKKLILNVGFSHPVEFEIPKNIDIKVDKNIISISGIDKQFVGEIAARIRAIRKPEPYKGKGIKYIDEVIRRKAGKVVKTAGSTA